MQRRTKPGPTPQNQPMMSDKKLNHLLQMADVIHQIKPIWKGHEATLPDWAIELIRLHDLWEKEEK